MGPGSSESRRQACHNDGYGQQTESHCKGQGIHGFGAKEKSAKQLGSGQTQEETRNETHQRHAEALPHHHSDHLPAISAQGHP